MSYALGDASAILTPALLFYKDAIVRNVAEAVRIAGGPERLRPHVKTHKTREIVRLELASGITRHKCATLAEAAMLADCGAPDVLVAYPLVGPACARFAALVKAWPGSRFLAQVDHPVAARMLSDAVSKAGVTVEVLVDVNVGQDRTGLPPGDEAAALYAELARLPGLTPGGLHVYDGHVLDASAPEREERVRRSMDDVLRLRARLERAGLAVPRIVGGGTPTFPIYARLDVPGLECSPGTFVLHDSGYGRRFADLGGFTPAALVLARVVSKSGDRRLTLDVGTKAIASDPPAGSRCELVGLPDARAVLHNEEHLVVETAAAGRLGLGDVVYVIPTHVCPTVALHREALVVEHGAVAERWLVAARDRLT